MQQNVTAEWMKTDVPIGSKLEPYVDPLTLTYSQLHKSYTNTLTPKKAILRILKSLAKHNSRVYKQSFDQRHLGAFRLAIKLPRPFLFGRLTPTTLNTPSSNLLFSQLKYNMLQLNIIIVGAGISGLSTAISLRHSGHKVTVLERHPSCQALGAPVGLSSNATRVLIHYGLGETMAQKASNQHNITIQRRYADGKILGTRGVGQSVKDYGFPSWVLARFRLQETLADVAVKRGVRVLFGKRVEGVELEGERVSVRLRGGEVVEGDLVVGADGKYGKA